MRRRNLLTPKKKRSRWRLCPRLCRRRWRPEGQPRRVRRRLDRQRIGEADLRGDAGLVCDGVAWTSGSRPGLHHWTTPSRTVPRVPPAPSTCGGHVLRLSPGPGGGPQPAASWAPFRRGQLGSLAQQLRGLQRRQCPPFAHASSLSICVNGVDYLWMTGVDYLWMTVYLLMLKAVVFSE